MEIWLIVALKAKVCGVSFINKATRNKGFVFIECDLWVLDFEFWVDETKRNKTSFCLMLMEKIMKITLVFCCRAYESSKLYRELKLRGAVVQDHQLRLLPKVRLRFFYLIVIEELKK